MAERLGRRKGVRRAHSEMTPRHGGRRSTPISKNRSRSSDRTIPTSDFVPMKPKATPLVKGGAKRVGK